MASLLILDLQMSAELAAIITDLTCELIVPILQPLLMQELQWVYTAVPKFLNLLALSNHENDSQPSEKTQSKLRYMLSDLNLTSDSQWPKGL